LEKHSKKIKREKGREISNRINIEAKKSHVE